MPQIPPLSRDIPLPKVVDIVKERWPDIWQRIFTKQIDPPPGYASFAAPAVALSSVVVDAMLKGAPNWAAAPVISNGITALAMLEPFDFPTYYISRSLFAAMQRTNPPDRKWSEMTLPYPACIFMLPEGAITEPDTGLPVRFVGYARCNNQTQIKAAGRRFNITGWAGGQDRIVVFWAGGNCLVCCDSTFPVDQQLTPSAEWLNEQTLEHWGTLEDMPPGDFSAYMAGLVANFILVMAAKPEWIEHGQRTSKKPMKSGVYMHSPTWLGRKYAIKREGRSEATGAHYTELGWRCGHWRTQHYGPGGVNTKEIFVEPYIAHTGHLVRMEGSDDNSTATPA